MPNSMVVTSALVGRNGPLARYAKFQVAHAPGMPGTFSPAPRISDPDMHHGSCVTHVPWCMPGSLTVGFLWSRWRGKRSRHSRRMRNLQFYVSGKRPMLYLITFLLLLPHCISNISIFAKLLLGSLPDNNIAHVTTSELSWHVLNYALVGSLFFVIQLHRFQQCLDYELKRFWKWVLGQLLMSLITIVFAGAPYRKVKSTQNRRLNWVGKYTTKYSQVFMEYWA